MHEQLPQFILNRDYNIRKIKEFQKKTLEKQGGFPEE